MLEVIAIVLLVIWGLGIVAQAAGTIYVYKSPEHPAHASLQATLDQVGPAVVVSLLTLLIVFWPAAVLYKLLSTQK